MKTALYNSPIGEITLAADKGALIGAWFVGQKYDRAGLEPAPESAGDEEILSTAEAWLNEYFAGKAPAVDLPLSPHGTEFQKRVWQALTEIPYGEYTSYGELAKKLGTAARALGSAVGKNPISLFIPCHRVLGADGALTGYAGGIERKKFILELEKTAHLLDKAGAKS